ncbi:hypothetical protein QTP88_019589 [Uroleucon formosanum]
MDTFFLLCCMIVPFKDGNIINISLNDVGTDGPEIIFFCIFGFESMQSDRDLISLQIMKQVHFLVLVTSIKSLEKSNLSLVDLINLIENTISQLQQKYQGLIILKYLAKFLKE